MDLLSVISGLRKGGRRVRNEKPPEPLAPRARPVTVWRRAAMKYDICRMTKADLRRLAEDLYAGGAISLPDVRLLSLDLDARAQNWPDWIHFETLGEHDGRRDWIGEVEARLAKGHCDPVYIGYLKRLLCVLKRVDAVRQATLVPASPEPYPQATPGVEPRSAAGKPAPGTLRRVRRAFAIF